MFDLRIDGSEALSAGRAGGLGSIVALSSINMAIGGMLFATSAGFGAVGGSILPVRSFDADPASAIICVVRTWSASRRGVSRELVRMIALAAGSSAWMLGLVVKDATIIDVATIAAITELIAATARAIRAAARRMLRALLRPMASRGRGLTLPGVAVVCVIILVSRTVTQPSVLNKAAGSGGRS